MNPALCNQSEFAASSPFITKEAIVTHEIPLSTRGLRHYHFGSTLCKHHCRRRGAACIRLPVCLRLHSSARYGPLCHSAVVSQRNPLAQSFLITSRDTQSLEIKGFCLQKTHRRFKKNALYLDKPKQNARIFEEILFSKATYSTKTNNLRIFCQLGSCGRKRTRD